MCVCVCVCVEVTGLLSQGRGEGNEWVTAFLVSYSLDAYHWSYVTDQYGNQRVNSFIHSFIRRVMPELWRRRQSLLPSLFYPSA